jgi:hypothetical protein
LASGKLNRVRYIIEFLDEVVIPDEFACAKIEYLNLSGKINKPGIERIIKMFPDIRITINGESVHGEE